MKLLPFIFLLLVSCSIEESSKEASSTNSIDQKAIQKKTPFSREIQNGDLIFQTSTSSQSKAIQLATNSKYSHVGIIYILEGKKYVF